MQPRRPHRRRAVVALLFAPLVLCATALPLAARAQTTPQSSFFDVAASGPYLYAAAGQQGLRVFDASDPSTLREVGAFSFGESVSQVVVAGTRAYLLGEAALHVVDVSDPTRPRQLGVGPSGVNQRAGFRQLAVNGTYVYGASANTLVLGNAGVAVLDASDPSTTRQVGLHDTRGRGVLGVGVVGPYVYAGVGCTWVCLTAQQDLQVVDVADPTAPRLVVDLPGPFGRVAVAGTYVYVEGAVPPNTSQPVLHAVDASDPARPRIAGTTSPLAANGTGISDVDVEGTRAYVTTTGAESVWIVIDVADPTRPTPMATYRAPESPFFGTRLAARGTTLYLASGSRLRAVDASDPTHAREVGYWDGVRFFSAENRRHLALVPQNGPAG